MKVIPEINRSKKEDIPLPKEENKTKIRIIIKGRKKDDIIIILPKIIKIIYQTKLFNLIKFNVIDSTINFKTINTISHILYYIFYFFITNIFSHFLSAF